MTMIQLIGLVMVNTGRQYSYCRRIARAFAALAYPLADKRAGHELPMAGEDWDLLLLVGIMVTHKQLFIKDNKFYKNDPVLGYEELKRLIRETK